MLFGFFKRLVGLGVTAAVVCAMTMFLTWTAVQTYADRLLTAYHLDTPEQKLEFSDFLSSLAQSLNTLTGKEVSQQNKQEVQGESSAISSAPAESAIASTASPTPLPTGNPAGAPNTGNAVPVMGSLAGEAGLDNREGKQDVVLSAKELNKKKGEISAADKMKIFSILSGSLPTDQVQHISMLVENGITADEMTDIQTIFQKYLKPDEIKQLTEVLKRY